MAEYIDKAAAIKLLTIVGLVASALRRAVTECVRKIELMPAADVEPVRHGRWEHLGGDGWCCSACGFVVTTEGSWDNPTQKYCEECGAKMDGGGEDAAD